MQSWGTPVLPKGNIHLSSLKIVQISNRYKCFYITGKDSNGLQFVNFTYSQPHCRHHRVNLSKQLDPDSSSSPESEAELTVQLSVCGTPCKKFSSVQSIMTSS